MKAKLLTRQHLTPLTPLTPLHLPGGSSLRPQLVKFRVPSILRFWATGMEANPLPHLHLTPLTPLTPLAPLHCV